MARRKTVILDCTSKLAPLERALDVLSPGAAYDANHSTLEAMRRLSHAAWMRISALHGAAALGDDAESLSQRARRLHNSLCALQQAQREIERAIRITQLDIDATELAMPTSRAA